MNLLDLPKDTFGHLLTFCHLKDHVSLSRVSKKSSTLLLNNSNLLKIARDALADVPDHKLKAKRKFNLDNPFLCIVESSLFPLGLIRCISGVFCKIVLSGAKKVYEKRIVNSNSEAIRCDAVRKKIICDERIERASKNIVRGGMCALVVPGYFEGVYAIHDENRLKVIRMIRGAISYTKWVIRIERNIKDSFAGGDKVKEDILLLLNEIDFQSTETFLLERLDHWVNSRCTRKQVYTLQDPPFYTIQYGNDVVQSRSIESVVQGIQEIVKKSFEVQNSFNESSNRS